MRYVIFDLNAYPDWGYKSIKSVLYFGLVNPKNFTIDSSVDQNHR